MAKLRPSINEALTRWDNPHILGIDTQVDYGQGVYGATLQVRSADGEVGLSVTGVKTLAGVASTDEVHKAFTEFIHAPTDAVALAAEVHRLRKKIDRLQEKPDL